MQQKLTPAQLEKIVQDLYVILSGATKEDENKQLRVFNGKVSDLFGNTAPAYWVTRFLWAVSNTSKALEVRLFKITNHGKKGYEIKRVNTGFGEKSKRVDGLALVPYIVKAMHEYEITPRKRELAKPTPIKDAPLEDIFVPEEPLEDVTFPDIITLTDGQLNMLEMHIAAEKKRRVEEAKKNAKRAELLSVFQEMARDEGFSLEDIVGMV